MTNKAAIYCRVSTSEPGVPKVEEQEARCRALALKSGYDVTQVYVDDGVSAFQSKKHRPGWQELNAAINNGEIQVLVFDRQDRLARDQFATLELMVACGRSGVRWHSVTEDEIDLTQAPHLMMATFRGGEAEGYSKKIQENVKRRNASDRAKGHPGHGPRPFGYTACRRKICEPEAELIRRAAAALLRGASKWDVVRMFNDSGIPTTRRRIFCPGGLCDESQKVPERRRCAAADSHEEVESKMWRPSVVYDVVGRYRNAALVEHEGEIVGKGDWPAILPEDDLRAVRLILDTPSQEYRGRPAQTLLTSIAVCQCGERMHAHGMSWGRVYRCASMDSRWSRNDSDLRHTAIKIPLLDELAREAVVSTYLLADRTSLQDSSSTLDIAQLHGTRAALQKKHDRLLSLYLAEDVSRALYLKKLHEIEGEVSEVDARLEAAARASAHARMLVEAQRRFIKGRTADLDGAADERSALRLQFDGLSLSDRRHLVKATVRLTVFSGRGQGRVQVEHIAAPSLDQREGDEM